MKPDELWKSFFAATTREIFPGAGELVDPVSSDRTPRENVIKDHFRSPANQVAPPPRLLISNRDVFKPGKANIETSLYNRISLAILKKELTKIELESLHSKSNSGSKLNGSSQKTRNAMKIEDIV
ncbi:hypothetical protein ACJJTC_008618 [Scirpophaga incertulas]